MAVQLVLAMLPRTIFTDLGTALRKVKERIRRPSEVLLSVSIVAFAPFVLLIYTWTKGSLVAVKHKLLQRQLTVK